MDILNDFIFQKIDGGYCLVKYNGKDVNVVVPATFDGEDVVEIGKFAFKDFNITKFSVENVTLPETIKRLQIQAFDDCSDLVSVNIPNSVVEIDEYAFYGCTSLREIHIPVGVSKIMNRTFENCSNLRKITCDNPVVKCAKLAFIDCENLEQVPMFIWKQLDFSLEISGIIALNYILHYETLNVDLQDEFITFLKKRKKLKDYLFTVDNGTVTNFLLTKITKLKLDQLNNILDENIKLKNTLSTAILLDYKNKNFTKKQIDKYTQNKEDIEIGFELPTLAQFKKTWKFTVTGDYIEITGYKGSKTTEIIPSGIKNGMQIRYPRYYMLQHFYHKFTKTTLEYVTFDNGEKMYLTYDTFGQSTVKEIVVPENLTIVVKDFFKRLTSLEKVVLPDAINNIQNNAFSECTNLKEINFPSCLEKICRSAFYKCESLKYVVFTPQVQVVGGKNVETVILKEVEKDAFAYTAIKEITFPQRLEKMEGFPFQGCRNLRKVIVAPSIATRKASCYCDCPVLEFVGMDSNLNVLDIIH